VTARTVDRAVAALAQRQRSVFSRAQALDCGANDGMISRRQASGTWLDKAEGVYGFPGVPRSWEQDLWVACLASTAGPIVSHESAAALHRLATFKPGPVVVTVPHGDSRVARVATVHQSRNLPADHLMEIDGLTVTNVPRTSVDLAMVCRRSRLEYVLDQSVADGKTSYDEIAAVFDVVAGRGRKGSRLLRGLLADRLPGYVPPSTRLEALLLRVLSRGGLRPVLQYPLPGRERPEGTVDAAYPDVRLLIEADSRRYHTRVRDFAVDRERDNLAMLAGWRVLRFTWDDLTKRPDGVIDCVARALRQLAA